MSGTLIIQIGNSDNKLTQVEWSNFVRDIKECLSGFIMHFSGGSANNEPYQNYCFIIECSAFPEDSIKTIRERYKQDSVAVTFGKTKFI